MSDPASWSSSISKKQKTVTPSDVTEFDPPLRKIRVGTAGDGTLTLVDVSDVSAQYVNVVAGEWFDGLQIKKIMNTGTGVSNIIGWE